MKKIFYMIGLMAAAIFSSCEKDLPLYSDSQARLNFYYKDNRVSDSLVSYSFSYHGNVQEDTIWFEVLTMGFPADYDRSFELEQVDGDAVAGTHYVSFDDAAIKEKFFKVKANAVSARVPVVVLRDASLKDKQVKLVVKIKDNGIFAPGYDETNYKIVRITDRLSKPDAWDGRMDYYFDPYGSVKHQFMIDVTGDMWDDDYINSFIDDFGYVSYLKSKLRVALEEENARRAAQGLDPLAEADSTPVTFGVW